jgi:hypothetical protein
MAVHIRSLGRFQGLVVSLIISDFQPFTAVAGADPVWPHCSQLWVGLVPVQMILVLLLTVEGALGTWNLITVAIIDKGRDLHVRRVL